MNDTPEHQSHYFDPSPRTPDEQFEYDLTTPRGVVSVRSRSGVFASRELDKGTSVLLSTLTDHPELWPGPGAHVCDLGCGAGPIALWLAAVSPEARIDAVDVNERAIDTCRDNAARLNLSSVHACHVDEVPGTRRYDMLVSNPPIRVGKEVLHSLLDSWLARLTDDGIALLVVGKNLGSDSLARWLHEQGYAVDKLASKKGFRVLRITRTAR